MDTTRRHAALVLTALLGAGLLAGAAAAGNPHGTPPGQAATPPGQAKKTQATSSTHGKAHQPNASSSTSTAGVKPSSTTQHNTHAAAGSNKTKLYGNGNAAGRVARQNGASSSTDLYGPGNSQPHKVAVCSKNGKTHYVDVHALKAHSTTCPTASANAAGHADAKHASGVAGASKTVSKQTIVLALQNAVLGAVKSMRSGGVLGARHTVSKPVAGKAKAAKAVVRKASFTG